MTTNSTANELPPMIDDDNATNVFLTQTNPSNPDDTDLLKLPQIT